MKKRVLIAALTLLVGSFAYAEIATLSPQQVYQELKSGQTEIFDVNPEAIYRKHHVPNVKNIKFDALLDSLPKDKRKKLIFYCMNEMCTSSHQAAEIAVKNGYVNVARMPSGISGWLKAGMPTEGM